MSSISSSSSITSRESQSIAPGTTESRILGVQPNSSSNVLTDAGVEERSVKFNDPDSGLAKLLTSSVDYDGISTELLELARNRAQEIQWTKSFVTSRTESVPIHPAIVVVCSVLTAPHTLCLHGQLDET